MIDMIDTLNFLSEYEMNKREAQQRAKNVKCIHCNEKLREYKGKNYCLYCGRVDLTL